MSLYLRAAMFAELPGFGHKKALNFVPKTSSSSINWSSSFLILWLLRLSEKRRQCLTRLLLILVRSTVGPRDKSPTILGATLSSCCSQTVMVDSSSSSSWCSVMKLSPLRFMMSSSRFCFLCSVSALNLWFLPSVALARWPNSCLPCNKKKT